MNDTRPVTFSERGRRYPRAARVVARVGFPILITTSVAALLLAFDSGIDPPTAMATCIVASYGILAIAERLLPYRDEWLHSRGDLRTDSLWFVINGAINRVLEPVALAGAALLGAGLAMRFGVGLWPVEWPWLAQLAMALVVAEFFEYWFHRGMHEVDALWRFHATHHSAPRLYWLNAVRFHVVDYIMVGIVKLLPLAIMGASVEVFALVNGFAAVHGAYQHSNLPVRLGPLNWIFSLTELHRWHHSPKTSEANHNYGGTLILWDIVFGTRYLPDDREPPGDIGIESMPHFPEGLTAQLLSPLRWSEVVRSSGSR
jgi:sterol desaturase/sphingolipid hydroxylase (fatty acid hydroxylase superfamily)